MKVSLSNVLAYFLITLCAEAPNPNQDQYENITAGLVSSCMVQYWDRLDDGVLVSVRSVVTKTCVDFTQDFVSPGDLADQPHILTRVTEERWRDPISGDLMVKVYVTDVFSPEPNTAFIIRNECSGPFLAYWQDLYYRRHLSVVNEAISRAQQQNFTSGCNDPLFDENHRPSSTVISETIDALRQRFPQLTDFQQSIHWFPSPQFIQMMAQEMEQQVDEENAD